MRTKAANKHQFINFLPHRPRPFFFPTEPGRAYYVGQRYQRAYTRANMLFTKKSNK